MYWNGAAFSLTKKRIQKLYATLRTNMHYKSVTTIGQDLRLFFLKLATRHLNTVELISGLGANPSKCLNKVGDNFGER